jgi:peroxiredoxin
LRAYQQILPALQGFGASLIAISPQTPDMSQATLLKNFLQYVVLSDAGNRVARQFGLVYPLADALKTMYLGAGVDLAAYNGDTSWELPLPGTFIVDRGGTVRMAYVDIDYTQRLEPSRILQCLASLAAGE